MHERLLALRRTWTPGAGNGRLLLAFGALALILGLFYLFGSLETVALDYGFLRRLKKVAAVLITGYAVAVSSVIFQTITQNRILTPSIIGFDSLYLLIQGVTLFVWGTAKPDAMSQQAFFIVNVALMVVFSELLFRLLFRREGSYIYFVLLAGVVCGMLFRSIFSFFMMLLDPDQFDILQTKMFASFNLISFDLLTITAVFLVLATLYGLRMLPELDAFLLGKENAHNLGVDVDAVQQRTMRIVAVMVAATTALVGPITFLGLMVVNIAYTLLSTYRHPMLLGLSVLISWVALFGGLILVERVFGFSTNLTVIINGIGGAYFIYLLLREGKAC